MITLKDIYKLETMIKAQVDIVANYSGSVWNAGVYKKERLKLAKMEIKLAALKLEHRLR